MEIILHAIARTASLNTKVLLKGGTLMGLAYGSPRLTSDIDLTASDLPLEDEIGDKIRRLLESAFPPAAATLGYADPRRQNSLSNEATKTDDLHNLRVPCLEAQSLLCYPRDTTGEGAPRRQSCGREN